MLGFPFLELSEAMREVALPGRSRLEAGFRLRNLIYGYIGFRVRYIGFRV